jgi:hypothetical protein
MGKVFRRRNICLVIRYDLYSKNFNPINTRRPVWKRVDTSTVALRVVQDDKKRTRCLGAYLGHSVTGRQNTGIWFTILGPRLKTLICKKNTVAKYKEVNTRCDLAESSKEGCGQKGLVCRWWLWMIKQAVIKIHKETHICIHVDYRLFV